MDETSDYENKLKDIKRKIKEEFKLKVNKHFFNDQQWTFITSVIGICLV